MSRQIKKQKRKKRKPAKEKIQTHLASEKALSKNWLTKKEDKIWQDLIGVTRFDC